MRRLASTAAVLTLLLAAGCGGVDDTEAEGGSGAEPTTTDPAPGEPGEPSPSESETASLLEPPVCEGLPPLSEHTGRGEPVELAAGDEFPVGGEAEVPTCYQQGPQGSIEIGLYADPEEGREMLGEIETNRLLGGISECTTPEVTGPDVPGGLVASLCQVPPNSPTPLPAAIFFAVPLGDGFVRCIAAETPGQTTPTPRLGDVGAKACVASVVALGRR